MKIRNFNAEKYNDTPTKQLVELTKVKDRGGNYTYYYYNANRGLRKTKNALNQTVEYEYCRCEGLSALIDERGKITSWHRDLNGRVIYKEFHDGKYIAYTYEAGSGLLSTVAYPKDVASVTFSYDAWYDRITSRVDGAGTWTYAYKPTSTAPSHPSTVNGAGQLASIDGPWADDTMSYTYDDLGRLTGRSMPGGYYYQWSESFTFDSLGRVKTSTNGLGTRTHTYVGHSTLLDKVTSTSGGVREIDYNYFPASSGRFLQQTIHRKTAGGTIISKHDYTYGTGSEFGQIKTWQHQLPANAASSSYVTTTQTFGYDAIGQLGSAAETGLPPRSYNYAAAGNRTSKSEDGTSTYYGVANGVNQILGVLGADAATSAYDDNGNLTSIVYSGGSRRLLEWDGINRLKRLTIQAGATPATGDKRIDFTYNAFGQRATQSEFTRSSSGTWSTGAVDFFRWDRDRVIQTRRIPSTYYEVQQFYPEGRLYCYYDGSYQITIPYYYTRDHNCPVV